MQPHGASTNNYDKAAVAGGEVDVTFMECCGDHVVYVDNTTIRR